MMKSTDLHVDGETIETSSPNSSTWKTYIAGRKSWGFSLSFLASDDSLLGFSDSSTVKDLLLVNSRYKVRIITGRDDGNDTQYVTGYALLTSASITGTVGNLATGRFSFVGDGPLE